MSWAAAPMPAAGLRTSPDWVVTLRVAAVGAWGALTLGWIVAGLLQTPSSPISGTISDLAATYAVDRWVMTAALAVTGVLLVVAGVATARTTPFGAAVLVIGGLGVGVVAAAPLPSHAVVHSNAAHVAFFALAVWPAVGLRVDGSRRQRICCAVLAAVVNFGLFGLFLTSGPAISGFAERLLATVCLFWICVQAFRSTPKARSR